MSERKSLSGGDWLSIGVFFVGTATAVLMSYGLWTGVGGASGTAALGAAIAGAIGPWPALIGGAGVALLGGRAFLTSERAGLLQGILGVLGLALGLAVVAGSLSPDRGGALGAATGWRVAELTHAAVGVLLGAIVAFGAAYFAWMREDPAAAAKLAPARRLTPAPPKSDDGVTAAESAMLFPAETDEEVVSPVRPIAAPAKPVKPLYPEDVRLKGEVPTGARPLTSPSALAAGPAIPAAPEPAVYRWTAPRAAAAPADPTRIAQEEIEALADVAPPIPETVAVVEETVEIAEDTDARPMPPRPTWETTGLAEDDEPVDAYGTPLSLVEKTRRDRDEAEEAAEETAPVAAARIPREIGAPEAEEEVDEDFLEDEDEEPVVAEVVAVAVQVDVAADDELLADEIEAEQAAVLESNEAEVRSEVTSLLAEQESLLQALRANNAALRADADAEDEYDVLEAEVVAETVEVEPEAELEEILDEEEEALQAQGELEEEEEEPVEATSTVVEAIEETEEIEAAEEVEEEPEPALAEAELDEEEEELEPESAVEAPEPAPVAAAAPARAKVAVAAAPSLFDAVETEPQVVLQPQAAVPASRAEKAPARGIDPEKKLLVEVGCMFVERGRVAVSMLQRQYDMDFDQACRVLDDLQEMGLIGPYMGGKNRDILLTKEQWMEKVGATAS